MKQGYEKPVAALQQVHFDIQCPMYYQNAGTTGVGFATAGNRSAFYEDAARQLAPLGWSVKKDSISSLYKGEQRLHLHPQSISGVVPIEEIEVIESALQGAATFTWTETHRYEVVYDLLDEAYREYLTAHTDEVNAQLKKEFASEVSKRKRTHAEIVEDVADMFHLERGENRPRMCGDATSRFVNFRLQMLIDDGELERRTTPSGERVGYFTTKPAK